MLFSGYDPKLVLGSKPIRSPLILSRFTGYGTGTQCFLSFLNVVSYCTCQSAFTCQDLWLGVWCFGTACSVLSGLCRKLSVSTLRRQRDWRQGLGGNLLAAVAIAQGFGSQHIGWGTWGSQHPSGWGYCRDRFRCKSSYVGGDCRMFRQPSVLPSVCRDLRGWSVTYRCLVGPCILNIYCKKPCAHLDLVQSS